MKLIVSGMSAIALLASMASAASATEIYSENTTLNAPVSITGTLEGSASLATTGGTSLDTCTTSEFKGSTSNTGGSGTEVSFDTSSLSFGSCTEPVTVTVLGKTRFKWTSGFNATVFGSGFHIDVNSFTSGTPCAYSLVETTHVGTFTGSITGFAILHADANVVKVTGGILCPASARFIATYVIVSPNRINLRDK